MGLCLEDRSVLIGAYWHVDRGKDQRFDEVGPGRSLKPEGHFGPCALEGWKVSADAARAPKRAALLADEKAAAVPVPTLDLDRPRAAENLHERVFDVLFSVVPIAVALDVV